ncbi:MAG: hypothetical protein AMXMBFR13_23860 [Phycisphaerae bacterium]
MLPCRHPAVSICVLVPCALACGCASTGQRIVTADDPNTVTGISRFEILEDCIRVTSIHTLLDQAGRSGQELSVKLQQSFRAKGEGCEETWTLTGLRDACAIFDVRGQYFSCTDPFAIYLAIPSRTSHWTVLVCSPGAQERPSTRPAWF